MPSLADMLAYCGIDYADDTVKVNARRALAAAVSVARGAIADDVDKIFGENEKLNELILIYAEDLYHNRGILNSDSPKVSGATRRMVNDIESQIRMEYRRLKAKAGDHCVF